MTADVTYIVRTTGDRMTFLADALASVKNQTRSSKALIVLDMLPGPARDAVVSEIVDKIEAGQLVGLVVADGVGMASAYNTGLPLVTSKYLGVLDDDDVLYSTAAAALAGALDDAPDMSVAHGYVRIMQADPKTNAPIKPRGDMGGPFTSAQLREANRIPVHAALVRTEVAQTEPWDMQDGPCCDWGYWLRLARRGVPFLHVHSLVGEYRIRGQGGNAVPRHVMARYVERVRSRWARW